MAKIVCEKCKTEYTFEVGKDLENCPVCGEPFESISSDNEEVDMEEFEHPDLYFYAIDSEDKYEDKGLRDVWCQCTSCREVNTISYNNFDIVKPGYLRLKNDSKLECEGCGKLFTNTIVPKRPDGWERVKSVGEGIENIPKCPICSSTKIQKISMTNKAASALTFGIFAVGHVSKTYKCNICGSGRKK